MYSSKKNTKKCKKFNRNYTVKEKNWLLRILRLKSSKTKMIKHIVWLKLQTNNKKCCLLLILINKRLWMTSNFLSRLVLVAMVMYSLLMTKLLMKKLIMLWNVLKKIKSVTVNKLVIWWCKKIFFVPLRSTHSLQIVNTYSKRMISCLYCHSSFAVVIYSITCSQLKDLMSNKLNSLLFK